MFALVYEFYVFSTRNFDFSGTNARGLMQLPHTPLLSIALALNASIFDYLGLLTELNPH